MISSQFISRKKELYSQLGKISEKFLEKIYLEYQEN